MKARLAHVLYRVSRLMGGPDWREDVDALHELQVVPAFQTAWICILNVIRTLTEAFSLVLLWPILQFIESNGDVASLAAKSRMWEYMVAGFAVVGIPITLGTLSGAVFALITLRQVVNYASLIGTNQLKESVSLKLRSKLFAAVLQTRASYLSSLGTGHFTALIGEQPSSAAAVLRNLVTLFSIYVTLASYLSVLLTTAPIPTLLVGVFAGVVVWLMRPLHVRAKKLSRSANAGSITLNQFAAERYKNWRLLKLAHSLKHETEQCHNVTFAVISANIAAVRAAGQIQLYLVPGVAAFALGSLWFAITVLGLTLAQVTLFVIVVLRLLPVLTSFLNTRQGLANVSVALHHVRDRHREALAEREADQGTAEFTELSQGIAFRGVSVHYPNRPSAALEEIDITIPAHRMTAITGPSGSGKSTLVDLIPRMLEPSGGSITLDGRPLTEFSLGSLRGRIAYVSQEPILFDGSVLDNVRYGRQDVTEEAAREACRLAAAEEFILALPDGYQTAIGEGGRSLSGGQRQRLALARIFLSDASILILDEPTSALDLDSELQIRNALETLRRMRQLTIIVIAHRLFTIRSADQLVVIKDGKVVEQGAPAQLAQGDGWYGRVLRQDSDRSVIPD